jgi:chromosome partitioning protein
MMRVVAVANHKGGVGKTTVAVNLASAFARSGRRVLVLDNDPQGHATTALGAEPGHFSLSTRDLYLTSDVRVEDARLEVDEGLWLLPAEIDLSTVELELADAPRRLRRLVERLAVSSMPYDLVLIDNPPHMGLLTLNALLAAREVIVPVDPGRFAVDAVGRFRRTLAELERERGHAPRVRLLANGFDLRTRYARRILEDLDALHPGLRCRTLLHSTVRLREAAEAGRPVDRLDGRCRAAADFADLAAELESEPLQLPAAEVEAWEEMLHGPRPGADGVRFCALFPEAEQVCVTGDFTDWSVEGIPLQRDEAGSWSVSVPMAPGCYEYKFIVDGVWKTDPENGEQVRNTYGQLNSVLVVPATPMP